MKKSGLRKIALLITCVCVVLALTACSSTPANDKTADNKPETITLTDNAGRTVELPYPVETAVVALRYTNELIRACGAIEKVIAVDLNTAQDREYWGMFDPENVIGKNQRELDYEKIVSLAPQVVILPANGAYEEAIEKLEPFGIKVFVISGYDTDDFVNQCANIGKMFNVEERATEFSKYFTDKLDYIDKQLKDVTPRTYYCENNDDYSGVLPGDTFYNMFELAHGVNIFAEDFESINAKEVDPEEIIKRNPDVIFKVITPDAARVGTGLYTPPAPEQFTEVYQSIMARPGWGEVTAIKDNQVYFMTQFSHGGACKLVGTMYAAKWLYPELLPDLDPDEVFRAWMEDWQGFKNVDGHFFSSQNLPK